MNPNEVSNMQLFCSYTEGITTIALHVLDIAALRLGSQATETLLKC